VGVIASALGSRIVAVVSALPPARRVQTLNIVDALAGR
jgi:ABC-type antimicrobial peptide transport system permease subunit